MTADRVAELAAMKQGSGLTARDLRALDIACSRILGVEPIDRAIPVVCPCHLCDAKTARKQRERPRPVYAGSIRQRRLARLYTLGFR